MVECVESRKKQSIAEAIREYRDEGDPPTGELLVALCELGDAWEKLDRELDNSKWHAKRRADRLEERVKALEDAK